MANKIQMTTLCLRCQQPLPMGHVRCQGCGEIQPMIDLHPTMHVLTSYDISGAAPLTLRTPKTIRGQRRHDQANIRDVIGLICRQQTQGTPFAVPGQLQLGQRSMDDVIEDIAQLVDKPPTELRPFQTCYWPGARTWPGCDQTRNQLGVPLYIFQLIPNEHREKPWCISLRYTHAYEQEIEDMVDKWTKQQQALQIVAQQEQRVTSELITFLQGKKEIILCHHFFVRQWLI